MLVKYWLINQSTYVKSTTSPEYFRIISAVIYLLSINPPSDFAHIWITNKRRGKYLTNRQQYAICDCKIHVAYTHLMNMWIPVGSIALLIPFHDAIIEYFCLAESGNRGSGAAGGGGSQGPSELAPSPFPAVANFPNSHPILGFTHSIWKLLSTLLYSFVNHQHQGTFTVAIITWL